MRRLTAVAATLLTTTAFVAPPRTRLHALAAVTTDDAIEQKLDSWLLDNLGSCAVAVDDDDDDAFELCSVDSPTAVWKSTSASGALTRPRWLRRAVGNRHRHAIEQWRTTRRFSTKAP